MLKSETPFRDPATFFNYANKYKKIREREKNWLIPLILAPTLCFSLDILQCRKKQSRDQN